MIKTLNLTANAETSASNLGGTHCRINNNTAGTLYASAKSGIVPGGDDVTAIPAGRGDYVVGTQGTVYLLSSSGGSVQVEGTDVLNRPFDNAAVTGGVAVGNPVVMDGLQGGVPFSEMVVSGKNLLLGIVNLYPTTNGNLVANSNVISVYAKCNPNTTYTIQRNGGSRLQCAATQALPSNGTTFSNLIVAADQTASTITYTTPYNCNYIVVYLTGSSEEVTDIQIEEGSTPTAYEPPITGRELTINACGKNLIPYPYIRQEVQTKEVTMVDNGDGTVTLSGTATANIIFWLGRFTIKAGKYTVSGFNSKYKDGRAYVGVRNGQGGVISNFFETSNSRGTVTISEDTEIQPIIYVNSGATFNGDIAAPQLELGGTATAYEPYHGAQYTITPDSNPYTVPDDIRQQNGLNVVTASAGTLEVVGVRKNAALKKVWDKLDELTTAVIVSTADLSE